MAWSGRGGASDIPLEVVDSFSSAAVKCVVSMPRASIKSHKFGPDSSSDDRRSGGDWALFNFFSYRCFLCRFHPCFQFGSHNTE